MRLAPTRLYFDTARLGLMTQSAQRANSDFAKLVGEEGLSLYATRWLAKGTAAMPGAFAKSFPGLAHWPGVFGLAESVRELAKVSPTRRVLFANRSAALARLAASALAGRCDRVFTVDLLWPCYRTLLAKVCHRLGKTLTIVRVRQRILEGQATRAELVDHLAYCFHRHHCDGLFLPAVTHDGIHFPAADLVRQLLLRRVPVFTVVDGAQALGHVPRDECPTVADIYIGSAHKWLASGLPLGMAVCQKAAVDALSRNTTGDSALRQDGLLRLTTEITSGHSRTFGATVHTAPLVTGHAAISHALHRVDGQTPVLRANRRQLAEVAQASGWRVVEPRDEFRTGVLLLQAPMHRRLSPTELGIRFQQLGIAVTCYPGGIVRVSAPPLNLGELEFASWRDALKTVAYDDRVPRQSNLGSRPADSTV